MLCIARVQHFHLAVASGTGYLHIYKCPRSLGIQTDFHTLSVCLLPPHHTYDLSDTRETLFPS